MKIVSRSMERKKMNILAEIPEDLFIEADADRLFK